MTDLVRWGLELPVSVGAATTGVLVVRSDATGQLASANGERLPSVPDANLFVLATELTTFPQSWKEEAISFFRVKIGRLEQLRGRQSGYYVDQEDAVWWSILLPGTGNLLVWLVAAPSEQEVCLFADRLRLQYREYQGILFVPEENLARTTDRTQHQRWKMAQQLRFLLSAATEEKSKAVD